MAAHTDGDQSGLREVGHTSRARECDLYIDLHIASEQHSRRRAASASKSAISSSVSRFHLPRAPSMYRWRLLLYSLLIGNVLSDSVR